MTGSRAARPHRRHHHHTSFCRARAMTWTSTTAAAAVVLTAAVVAVIVRSTAARLLPVAVAPPDEYRNESEVLRVCRTTARDVQPFVLVVFLLAADAVPDGFMRLVHDAVGTAVLVANRVDDERRMDGQVALMVADEADAVSEAIENGQSVWDQMSHYIWLMPAGRVNRSEVERLFRAAWKERTVVNVVAIVGSAAYTYDPFADKVAKQRPVDADQLRSVARRKMNDLYGLRVRICMFPTRLKAVKQPDGTYKGTDGIVVSTLAKHMNFTPVYSEPSDGRKYGWAELNADNANTSETTSPDLLNPEAHDGSNYTYTGLLGDLVYNKVDMAFNGAFLKAYHSNNSIRYTAPVMFDELCFVVPNAQQMSQWRAVFTAFDVILWYFLAVAFVVALSAWTLIRRTTNKPYTLTLLAINLFRIFLMVPLNRVPNNIPERLMVVSTVLFGFIMATSLQAVMVKYLSYPKYEQNVATVQELYDTGMPVLSASANLILLFESDDSPLYANMSDRFVIVKNKSLDILGEVASKRSSAAIGRKNDLVEKIASSYVKNNEVLLHIVDECPRSFYIVYLVRRDVPFMNAINRIITIFVESGIVNSWFMHAKPFRPISDYHHRKDPHKVFTMKNVVIAFLCLMIGLIVSGIAFVAELIYFHKFTSPEIATLSGHYPRKPLLARRF